MSHPATVNGHPRRPISPRARRLARERGLDFNSLTGSGPGGRIVAADLQRAAASTTTPLSTMRRAIVRATTQSAAIPQFSVSAELDASLLVSLREQLVAPILSDAGAKLSITDFLLVAQARALAEIPTANAIWRNESIERLSAVAVGLIVAVDDGLLLPTIAGLDRLPLAEVVRRRGEVIAAARSGRQSTDAAPAATSLSNLGNSRVDHFTALLMPPQSTMLAVGRIAARPYVVDNQVVARPTLRLSLTADHRVLDGIHAAEYLSRIVEYLEQPARLLHQPRPQHAKG